MIKSKYFATGAAFVSYIALGLLIGSLGASFLQLQKSTSSTPEQLTFVFTLRSFGYIIGSAAGGILLDKFPKTGTPMIAFALFMTAVSTAIIPSAHSLELLFFLGSTQGIAMGMLDTVANVLIIHMWKEEAGPWMQGLHCSFAVGAVSAPLAVRLSQSSSSSGEDISGAFYFFSAFCFLCALYFCFVPTPEPRIVEVVRVKVKVKVDAAAAATTKEEAVMKHSRDAAAAAAAAAASLCRCCSSHMTIIVTTGALLGLYVGCETSFGGFILLYSQKQYGMTEADGQYLNSVFWGALLLGRFLGIPCAKIISVTKQLIADLFLACLGCIILMIGLNSGHNINEPNFEHSNQSLNETVVHVVVATEAGLVGQLSLDCFGRVWIRSEHDLSMSCTPSGNIY